VASYPSSGGRPDVHRPYRHGGLRRLSFGNRLDLTSCVRCGKIAIALILLDWHRRSAWRTAVVAALAWAAVQIYTGNIFVAVGVFAALVADSIDEPAPDWRRSARYTGAKAAAVLVMQIPYAADQVLNRFSQPGMGAVTGSITSVLTGRSQFEFSKSVRDLTAAIEFTQGMPWHIPYVAGIRLRCACLFALRFHRDRALILVTVLPLVAAFVGYAAFRGGLDRYTFVSLVPPAVLMMVLAVMPTPGSKPGQIAGFVALLGSLALVPARLEQAAQWHKLPEYRVLVRASRKIVGLRQPMRAIQTAFVLPPTTDPTFIYTILGGRVERSSEWVAVIQADGEVIYRRVGGS